MMIMPLTMSSVAHKALRAGCLPGLSLQLGLDNYTVEIMPCRNAVSVYELDRGVPPPPRSQCVYY